MFHRSSSNRRGSLHSKTAKTLQRVARATSGSRSNLRLLQPQRPQPPPPPPPPSLRSSPPPPRGPGRRTRAPLLAESAPKRLPPKRWRTENEGRTDRLAAHAHRDPRFRRRRLRRPRRLRGLAKTGASNRRRLEELAAYRGRRTARPERRAARGRPDARGGGGRSEVRVPRDAGRRGEAVGAGRRAADGRPPSGPGGPATLRGRTSQGVRLPDADPDASAMGLR